VKLSCWKEKALLVLESLQVCIFFLGLHFHHWSSIDYEKLKPGLENLIKAHKEDLELVASLEKRIATLMNRNTTQVDALSELFVAWDDTLTEAEDKISRLEREKAERLRLGLEKDTSES